MLTAALSAVALTQELPKFPTFESFMELHARSYQRGSAEFEQRSAVYAQNVAHAEIQNNSPDRKWHAGVNRLWDWTEDELKTLRGWDGSMMPLDAGSSQRGITKHTTFLQQEASLDDLPKEKSWADLETFSNIKDQGGCGSCWAIAASTVLEAHNEIYNKKHRVFSPQQLVDCTPNPRKCGGAGGCEGATPQLGFEWVMKHGIADEAEIPYKGEDGKCSVNTNLLDVASHGAGQGGAAIGMTGWSTLPKNKYAPLLRALAEEGPVTVSVDAGGLFSIYMRGIFNDCGKDAIIGHAVVAVGYGEQDGQKYWKIQNSWGKHWGESGYIRLSRSADDEENYCGMDPDPQKGVACEGETAPVKVCGQCGVLFDSNIPHFKGSKRST